jgi:AcrR family transcriptional regulator
MMIKSMIESSLEYERDDDAAARIVDAAERLFIRDGIDATSLRAVTREAGVNVAAIHYYFGSRDELLRAVLDRVVRPVNQRRMELLDRALAKSKGRALPVREILRIFLLPDLEVVEQLRDRGVEIAHFVARSYAAPPPILKKFIDDQFGAVADRFLAEIARSLPSHDPKELAFRFLCIVGVIVRLLGTATPRGTTSGMDTADIAGTLERLIDFIAPGLSAPKPREKH